MNTVIQQFIVFHYYNNTRLELYCILHFKKSALLALKKPKPANTILNVKFIIAERAHSTQTCNVLTAQYSYFE